jgi:hypothetical protein
MDDLIGTERLMERPLCQKHGERLAVETCTRCGRFACGSCLGEQSLCPECVKRQSLSLPASAPRARLTIRFLSANVAIDALSALIGLSVLTAEPSTTRDVIEGFVDLGSFGLFVGTAIVFLRWLHLAVRQTQALDIDVGVTPRWAVACWFIPFVNLVKPYQTIRDLLRGLGGRSLVGAARVGLWWCVWLVANWLSRVEGKLVMRDGLDAPTPSEAYSVGIFADLASIAGALLCIGLIRVTQQALDEKRQIL